MTFVLIIMLSAFPLFLHAQVIATLEVNLVHPSNGIMFPSATNLDQLTSSSADDLSLQRIDGGKPVPIAFQVSESGGVRFMHWLIEPDKRNAQKFIYQLVKSKASISSAAMKVVRQDETVTIQNDSQRFLRYYFKKLDPPAGVDSAYGRSGFIHPLWSPKGYELTRIQPPDHYHHYGIWNPWTHVLYKGDTIDFWNLNKKKGTVRFAKLIDTSDGPVFAEYKVLHEHVVLRENGEEVALNEIQTVRVYQPSESYYIADISIDLKCASQEPFHILTYRYGGLGWRATGEWNNKNSEVLTSENKTRKDADSSTARWCLVQGAIGNDYAGGIMMSSPSNYNHPEPLRIWPENQYDRGDMFVNFSPTKNKDWQLLPGETYSLLYRFIVFDGKFDREKCETAWQLFANPVKVIIEKR